MKQYKNYIFDFYGTLVDIETDENKPSFWKKMAEIYRVYGADYDFLYHISNSFRVLSRKRIGAYKHTCSTLKTLKERGCNVYLLSNAQGIFTRPEIELTGVAEYMDDIFISSDHQRMKPDPVFLNELISKHRLEKENTVMIGNDFSSDMAIAQACGVDGIFLNSFAYDAKELKEKNRFLHPIISDISEILE